MTDRLDARLVAAGAGPRKTMQQAIRRGRVTIDGVICTDAKSRLPGTIALDGVVHELPPTTILINKPIGYSCSHNPTEAPLLFELLPAHWPDFQTIGRLDRDTTGLLVLTTDGQLNHRIASPKHAVTKEYHLTFTGELKRAAVKKFSEGITLDDGPCRPALLELHGQDEAIVTVTEGRYHQVKRMISAVGGTVTRLHRQRVGGLLLPDDLSPGNWRAITAEELESLDDPRPLLLP